MRDSGSRKYKEIIVPIVLKFVPHAKVILYGSRARGDWTEGSDIDIALDAGQKIGSRTLALIISAIEESKMPINFDIVDLHEVSKEMRKEILKNGVIWKE